MRQVGHEISRAGERRAWSKMHDAQKVCPHISPCGRHRSERLRKREGNEERLRQQAYTICNVAMCGFGQGSERKRVRAWGTAMGRWDEEKEAQRCGARSRRAVAPDRACELLTKEFLGPIGNCAEGWLRRGRRNIVGRERSFDGLPLARRTKSSCARHAQSGTVPSERTESVIAARRFAFPQKGGSDNQRASRGEDTRS